MSPRSFSDNWERGSPYEQYIGRWSRRVAPAFLDWLDVAPGKTWLDIGCGTGALCAAIADRCAPARLVGIDPSQGFLTLAAQNLAGSAELHVGSASAIPLGDGEVDAVVSGLVLNFIPDLPKGLAEMRRVATSGGLVAAYVWDYAGKMELIRHFWDAAVSLDADARHLHEGVRFPLCSPTPIGHAFDKAGFQNIEFTALDVSADFVSFDDYWLPFLGGQGPAPAYTMSLSEDRRSQLRAAVQAALPTKPDGSISLNARAWAVRASTPRDAHQ